jgi:hypothetical protein
MDVKQQVETINGCLIILLAFLLGWVLKGCSV